MLFFRNRKNTDRKRSTQSSHIHHQVSHLRPLRCEPLEDRRMLSITFFADGGDGSISANDLQDTLPQAIALHAAPKATNNANQIWVAEEAAQTSEKLQNDDALTDCDAVAGDTAKASAYSGTTYLVESLSNTIANDGVLTFIEAFQASNYNQAFGDAVAGSSVYQDVIRFTTGLSGTVSVTGEFVVNDDLSIEGSGAGLLTFSGGHSSRVFFIQPSVTASLSGMTVTAGYSDYGGAIYCGENSSLTISDSTLSGNSTSQDGGAIYNYAGTLSLVNSSVSGSSGYNGAGIYNFGSLTVTNSTFSNNSASNDGGAICNSTATVNVTGSTFSNNSAVGFGGAIDCYSSTVTISSTTFSDNSATYGAAVDNYSSTTSITSSSMINNSASQYGGGVYNYTGQLTVANSTLSGNTTLYYGGGICNHAATLTVTNSTLSDNTAQDYSNGAGGGIYSGNIASSATLNNTIIAGNTAAYGDDIYCYEGGLYGSYSLIGNGSSQSSLTNGYNGNQIGSTYYPIDPMLGDLIQFDNGLWGYDIAANSPAVDAGLNSLAVSATGQLLSGDIAGNDRIVNSTVDIGSTEYCVDEIPSQTYVVTSLANTIANDGVLTFIEAFEAANTNLPVGDAQAGSDTEQDTIQFAEGLTGTVLVNDGNLNIEDDLAIEGPGAELLTFDAEYENRLFLIQTDVIVAFSDMTITHGSTGSGGGIYNKGTLTLTDVTVSDNEVGSYGGGIYNYYGTLTLNHSMVANNKAKERISGGGGIYNSYGSLTIVNSTISGNSVPFEDYNEGGGIYNSGTLAISNSTISENSINGYGGGIYNKGTLSIEDSTLSDNSMLAGGSGGAIYNEEASTATVANSSLKNNSSEERGGAIQNFGEMTISDSLFSGNSESSTGGGGAINNYSGSLIVTNSTFEGNEGQNGGGIYNESNAILNIANSTFANNTARSGGGGIFNFGTMIVTNSTLSNNSAAYGGGLRDYNSESGILNNCIVAGNWASSRGPEIDHSTYYDLSGSNNVIGNGSGQSAFTDGVDDNQVGTSSDVSSLLSEWSQFDNGLWGFYLIPGSSAINAGNNSLAVDADGHTLSEDISGNTRIVGGIVDIGAFEGSGTNIPSQIYVVSSLEMTIANDGILTFKEAFEAANSNRSIGDAPAGSYSEQDVIRFAPGLSGNIILGDGELTIGTHLAIEGSGAELITFDAEGQSGVFSIEKNCDVSLSGITITGGADYSGAGITNEGTLVIEDVILRGNSAENSGGAIYNYRGELTVINSTISGNSAAYKGGGIRNQLGTLTVTNSAIVNNSPSGIHYDGSSSSTTLNNTIVAGNVGTSYTTDIYKESGRLYGSHNLIGNGSKQTSLVDGVDGNMVGTTESPIDPLLSDWTQSENGLWGYYPLPGSPVLDAGDNSLALDSAGQPIVEDMDGSTRIQNSTVDLGPFEGSVLANSAQVYMVTSLEESIAKDGVLTFLEAFEAAKRNQPVGDAPAGSCSEQDVIQFADTLSGTITVAGKEITLFGKLSIEGPGSDQLTFDGGEQNRVFYVRPNASISLSGLTVTGGSADMGGGVFNDAANLTLTQLVVSDSSASDGGGIYNLGTLTVRNSTIADNSANRSGGGIYTKNMLTVINSEILDNSGTYGGGICNEYSKLNIVNSTLLRNQASYGGGIRNLSGIMNITNSTIVNNSAYTGSGIENQSSAYATLNNTIVANNSRSDFYNNGGSLTGSFNLIGNGSWQSALVDGVDGNQIGSSTTPIDPMLDEMGCPLTNSPVIDAGDNSLVPTGVTTDIADNDRIQNGTVDIGAYETESLTPRLPGDANSDGKVDGSDVTILAGNWQAGVTSEPNATWSMGDFNADGKVDGSDVTILAGNWQAGVNIAIPGDANSDGRVDGSDVTILAGNWQAGVNDGQTATWSMGDFNADGKVDGSDVTILAGNWQAGVTSAVVAVSDPEPEPTSCFTPPANTSLGIATVPRRESLPPHRLIMPRPKVADAILAESTWSNGDYTAIAKDIASVSAKKLPATSDKLFALEIDPYSDLQ